jgi:hypothetical protein
MNFFNKRKIEKAEEILEKDKIRKKRNFIGGLKSLFTGLTLLLIFSLAIAALLAPEKDEEAK